MLTLVFASCVKDDDFENHKYGVIGTDAYKVIDIPSANTTLTTTGTYPLAVSPATTPATFLPATTPVVVTVPVHLSANDPAKEDLGVTLSIDQADTKIAAYNATLAAASRYVRMPTDKITLSDGGVAKIAAGSRDGSIKLTFVPSTLTAGRYIIPVSIASVDKSGYTISGNQGYRLVLAIIR